MLFLGVFFFFNDTATTEIYTLSLHDALPISDRAGQRPSALRRRAGRARSHRQERRASLHALSRHQRPCRRSEEHTSELQSRQYLVCRLLLEKKKIQHKPKPVTSSYIQHHNIE